MHRNTKKRSKIIDEKKRQTTKNVHTKTEKRRNTVLANTKTNTRKKQTLRQTRKTVSGNIKK